MQTATTLLTALVCFCILSPRAAATEPDLMPRVRQIIQTHCPEAQFTVDQERHLVAKHGTMLFTLHARTKGGPISERTHQHEGPNYRGFMVSICQLDGDGRDDRHLAAGVGTGGPIFRKEYWQVYIAQRPTEDGKDRYAIRFSFGASLNDKFKAAMFAALMPAWAPGAVRSPVAPITVNTQPSLAKLVGPGFEGETWTDELDLPSGSFAGLQYVGGPNDPKRSPKGAWRMPFVYRHIEFGAELHINCYRRRTQDAPPVSPDTSATPFMPLTEPNYPYQTTEFHNLKAATASKSGRTAFVFLDGDILFKVEVLGATPQQQTHLARSTAESIWKHRNPK